MPEKNNIGKINRKYVTILGALYFIALIWIVIFKCNVNVELCLEQNRSRTIWERLVHGFSKNPIGAIFGALSRNKYPEVISIAFNLICLIPLGAAFRFFYKRSHALLISFITVIGIELFQLFSGYGGIEPTDIIVNTSGACLGVCIFERMIVKINPLIVNRTALVLICLGIPFDLFCIINTIIHFPG